MGDVLPEVYCLKWEHLFAYVRLNSRLRFWRNFVLMCIWYCIAFLPSLCLRLEGPNSAKLVPRPASSGSISTIWTFQSENNIFIFSLYGPSSQKITFFPSFPQITFTLWTFGRLHTHITLSECGKLRQTECLKEEFFTWILFPTFLFWIRFALKWIQCLNFC